MLIKNGTLVSPGTNEIYRADLRTEGAFIKEIGHLAPLPDEEVLDASACVIAPGLVDVHVHFRDPGFTYKEDLHTGALAAAAGGYTTVVCMANTKPAIDNKETLLDLIRRAEDEKIHVRFDSAVSRNLAGKELVDFQEMAQNGAWGFTDDGIPLMDEKLVMQAMLQAKELSLPLSFHEEDPAFIEKSGTNRTAPAAAENVLVARDSMIALYTCALLNIQHISSAASVALVRTAKALGAKVWAEATPHHFSLTEEAVEKYGSNAKMNPPLRTETDRLAIIEGLKDGSIDMIATDHAPHSADEKGREDLFSCPSGIIGLETALGLGITYLVEPGHLTMMELLSKMTVMPARLYYMDAQADQLNKDDRKKASSGEQDYPAYGSLKPGNAADLVIFNPDESYIAGNYHSKSANSPFTGWELKGKIHYTICDGKVAFSAEA